MKLYRPDKIHQFVFAVIGSKDKEGTPAKYVSVQGSGIDDALDLLTKQGHKEAAPHCMGRYDELGRYMTYQPPVEGIRPGKFILHPLADKEYKESRAY